MRKVFPGKRPDDGLQINASKLFEIYTFIILTFRQKTSRIAPAGSSKT